MKAGLEETICHILQRLGLISDWVVEQGTSGIWTYRKWNSGIAECWGRTYYKVTSNSAWGNLYEGQPGKYENYPNGLFIETPNLTVSNDYAGYTTCGSEIYTGHSASRTPTIYGLRSSDSSVNLNAAFNMYARGLWKSLGG